MKIKYINHSCFLIEINNTKIVIDPYVENEEQIKCIENSDFALISHGHNDHTDGLKYLSKNTTIITNFELSQLLNKKFNAISMNIGGEITFNFNGEKVVIAMVKALHTSSYIVNNHIEYGGEPCGFIIKTSKKTLYFMGDTDMFGDMKIICDYYKPNIILMPIGNHYTMGIDKALFVINNGYIKCDYIIPMHYNLTTEKHYPIDVSKKEFEDFTKKSKIKINKLNKLQEIEI